MFKNVLIPFQLSFCPYNDPPNYCFHFMGDETKAQRKIPRPWLHSLNKFKKNSQDANLGLYDSWDPDYTNKNG